MRTKEEIIFKIFNNVEDENLSFIQNELVKNSMEEYAKEYHENEMKKLNWEKIRIDYFDECVYYPQLSLPIINFAPHDLFEWFKERIMRDLILNKKDE